MMRQKIGAAQAFAQYLPEQSRIIRRNQNIKFREKLNSILSKNSMEEVYMVRKNLAESVEKQKIDENMI